MNVNSVQQSAQNSYLLNNAAEKKLDKPVENTQKSPDVVVDLGKNTNTQGIYGNPKRLTAEQVQTLKDSQLTSQANFMQSMLENNVKKQADQFLGITKLNFDGVMLNASDFELPPGGTTPEEAAAAVAEGGEYSVNAVADRIFSMAEKLANGDPVRLQTLKDAVQKGFDQAGLDFSAATKTKLPQISNDTYDEIMNRFDQLTEQLTPKQPETNPVTQPE